MCAGTSRTYGSVLVLPISLRAGANFLGLHLGEISKFAAFDYGAKDYLFLLMNCLGLE